MIGGLVVLTFMSRRQFSLLLIIGVMSIGKIICDFVDKYDKNGTEEFTKLMMTWKGKILTIVLIVLSAYCMYIGKVGDEYVSSRDYPVALADYMISERDAGNLDFSTMKLYNDYNYGSYLLYRGIPVFIDSRADLYSPEFNENCHIFDDCMNISGLGVYYEDAFEEYKITHVAIYRNSKLNMLIQKDENYKKLHEDNRFVLYEREGADIETDADEG